MKNKIGSLLKLLWVCFALAVELVEPLTRAQGTLVYDQQSATNVVFGGSGFQFNSLQPVGQSFTPSQGSVGFVQFKFVDSNANGSRTMVFVNLRAASISGNVVAASDPVELADNFLGIVSFFFGLPVSVTPGTTYYFQPVIATGETQLQVIGDYYNYLGGTAYFQGAPSPDNSDLWFREGYVVPESSTLCLGVLGAGLLLLGRHCRRC